jgi:radical SAM protein with 4Fe4S-binding SPASM domain
MSSVQRPRELLSWESLERIVDGIISVPEIRGASFYSIGENYLHPDYVNMVEWAVSRLSKYSIETTVLTNGSFPCVVPEGIDNYFISFNAGTKKTYETITGLSFEKVVGNIRNAYATGEFRKSKRTQIHMLVFDENRSEIDSIRQLFRDLRSVQLRLSHKFDNQHGELAQGNGQAPPKSRIPCSYITDRVTFYSNGDVILCPHDFDASVAFGNIISASLPDILNGAKRQQYLEAHRSREFEGLCRACNFNVPSSGLFEWVYFHPHDRAVSRLKGALTSVRTRLGATRPGMAYKAMRNLVREVRPES